MCTVGVLELGFDCHFSMLYLCICSFLDRISDVRQPEYLPNEQVCYFLDFKYI